MSARSALHELVTEGAITVSTGVQTPAGWQQALVTVLHLDGDLTVHVARAAIDDDGEVRADLRAEHEGLLVRRIADVHRAVWWAGWAPAIAKAVGVVAIVGSSASGVAGALLDLAEVWVASAILAALSGALVAVGGRVGRYLVRRAIVRAITEVKQLADAEAAPTDHHERSQWLLRRGRRRG